MRSYRRIAFALLVALLQPSLAPGQTATDQPEERLQQDVPIRLTAVIEEQAPSTETDLLRRLDEAEQQIGALQQQLDEMQHAAGTTAPGNAPSGSATSGNTQLKKQVLSWVEEKKKCTFPNVSINGVFQADAGFFHQDAESVLAHGRLQDGADFRRARLSAKGAVTETVNYFLQMDFGFFGRPTFTDVWVEQKNLPGIGNLRIGQWKQPFSLEVVSSFRYTTFMERSLLFQPFTPFRHLGAGIYDHSDDLNWTWAASGFRTGQDQFGGSVSTSGGWGTAERVTHLFYWDDESKGRAYLHGGVGHFYSNPPHNTVNFRTIPELYIGEVGNDTPIGTSGQPTPGPNNGTPFFVQTGPRNVEFYNVLGTELLWVNGPLSIQSEAMVALVNETNQPNATLPGYYVQLGYFLTGEHRPYDRAAGAIDRVTPFTNFFAVNTRQGVCSGMGAWEVAVRLSQIDLQDEAIQGGTLTNLTAGVNWYWNPYTKMVFNYIHAWNDSTAINPANGQFVGKNDTDLFAARLQVDF